MAKAAARASVLTTLKVGQVELAIGLFASSDKPGGLVKFDTAGPNGGVLMTQEVARAMPIAEAVEIPDAEDGVKGDPLGDMCEAPETHMLGGAGNPATRPSATAAAGEGLGGGGGGAGVAGVTVVAGPVAGAYGRELVEEGSGAIVLPQDVRRGVRREDGSFIDCTEHVAAITEKTKLDAMEIVAFVPLNRVSRARVRNAYYLGAADEKAPKGLALIYAAMRARNRVAVVKLTKKSRQSLGVISWDAREGVLLLLEVVWAEDFRPAPARALVVAKAQVSAAEVEMACALVDAMSDSVAALDELRDDAIALREELYAKALAGEIEPVDTLVDAEVVDEVDTLIKQLAASLAGVE